MISAGWLILAALGGGTVGVILMALVAGGTQEGYCMECPYRRKFVEHKGSYGKKTQRLDAMIKAAPPPKHSWEMTHAEKPARNLYRENGRKR